MRWVVGASLSLRSTSPPLSSLSGSHNAACAQRTHAHDDVLIVRKLQQGIAFYYSHSSLSEIKTVRSCEFGAGFGELVILCAGERYSRRIILSSDVASSILGFLFTNFIGYVMLCLQGRKGVIDRPFVIFSFS